jgi:glycosyltransferase involved in cell wall biosynthesis
MEDAHLPKRILFINHSVRHGGPGRSLFYLLKHLDRSRIMPLILVPKHDVFSEQIGSIGLLENVIVDPRFPENIMRQPFFLKEDSRERGSVLLKALSIGLNLLLLLSLILTSPFLIRRKRIDLIYCNGTLAKMVGALIGMVGRRPVVWHVRNIQQRAWMKAAMGCLARLPSVKTIICVSRAAAEPFEHLKKRVVVINNGLDIEEWDPASIEGRLREEFGIPKEAVVIGSTGRIVPRKGFEYIIDAAKKIKRGGLTGKRLKFVIVGDTPHFFRINHLEHLKQTVAREGLSDDFVFTGYKADVRGYLKDFDIFIIPSNYPDPFPRAVIEAMALSLPVVGFRQGGIVEAVEDGVTGFLLAPEEGWRMSEKIVQLAEDEELRAHMGRAGRERVKALFQARDTAQRVEEEILAVFQGK